MVGILSENSSLTKVSSSPVTTLLRPYLPYLANPLVLFALFLMASMGMIWRLQAIEAKGFEGTVLGSLIMPYCSGFANLIFAYVMAQSGNNGRAVMENCIVNNVTNLTLILGVAAIFSRASSLAPAQGKGKKQTDVYRLYKLDLLLTLVALCLFTGATWALGKDKVIDFYDGLVLVALFVFWQVLHVVEILKTNVRKNRSFQWSIVLDLALIGACAYGVYYTVDALVNWVSLPGNPYFNAANLGWLSGILMVLPNALIAVYYAYKGRQDIVVSSQVGDGHICIPMCIGLFALFAPIHVPGFFQMGIYVILGAAAVHFFSIALFGRLPRILGAGMLAAYGSFLYAGLGA
jgi:cation:H+ antiporter